MIVLSEVPEPSFLKTIKDFENSNILRFKSHTIDPEKKYYLITEEELSTEVFYDEEATILMKYIQMEMKGRTKGNDSKNLAKLSLEQAKGSYSQESYAKDDFDEKVIINLKKRPQDGTRSVSRTNSHMFIPKLVHDMEVNQVENLEVNILDSEKINNSFTSVEKKAPEVQKLNPDLISLLRLDQEPLNDWQKVHTSKFITVYKKRTEDSPVILLKAISIMPDIPADKAIELIHNIELRKKWDDVLHNMKIFDHLGNNVDHMYSLFKAPIGMSNRDFVQRRTRGKDIEDA
jgi:START domain